jgi:hypothetical protein
MSGELGTGGRRRPVEATWISYRQAARLFLTGATLGSATRIALVVGTWLSLMNQGRLIVDGHPPWLKLVLNYATPFTVATLGFLAGRRHRNVERLMALLRSDSHVPGTNPPASKSG